MSANANKLGALLQEKVHPPPRPWPWDPRLGSQLSGGARGGSKDPQRSHMAHNSSIMAKKANRQQSKAHQVAATLGWPPCGTRWSPCPPVPCPHPLRCLQQDSIPACTLHISEINTNFLDELVCHDVTLPMLDHFCAGIYI